MKIISTLIVIGLTYPAIAAAEPPDWLEPMRAVHAGFTGERGYVALLGDSITESLAFWKPLLWDEPGPYLPDDDLPKNPSGVRWREAIKGVESRGAENGNQPGWAARDVLAATDRVLQKHQPECAIIMVGTNDVSETISLAYRKAVDQIVAKCLAAHCVPILNTIPPRRGRLEQVIRANKFIRDIAAQRHVPLVDYYQLIVDLRPDTTWDGTLISADGIHPTAEKPNNYAPDNLAVSGYALRTFHNFLMYRRLYFEVFNPGAAGQH